MMGRLLLAKLISTVASDNPFVVNDLQFLTIVSVQVIVTYDLQWLFLGFWFRLPRFRADGE